MKADLSVFPTLWQFPCNVMWVLGGRHLELNSQPFLNLLFCYTPPLYLIPRLFFVISHSSCFHFTFSLCGCLSLSWYVTLCHSSSATSAETSLITLHTAQAEEDTQVFLYCERDRMFNARGRTDWMNERSRKKRINKESRKSSRKSRNPASLYLSGRQLQLVNENSVSMATWDCCGH